MADMIGLPLALGCIALMVWFWAAILEPDHVRSPWS